MTIEDQFVPSAFAIGEIVVEPARNMVRRGHQSFAIEPRIMDVLCLLVRHAGDVVPRDTLIEEIWQVEYGGEDSLTRAISLLRKTFREAGAAGTIIETIPKRGYRFAATLSELTSQDAREDRFEGKGSETSEQQDFGPRSIPSAPDITPGPVDRTRQIQIAVPVLALCAVVIAALAVLWPRPAPEPREFTVSTRVEIPEHSIAVLPFADLSEAGDQAYFSDGVSEEILNLMTRLEGLSVAGRTSSFAFKDSDTNLKEIGETLKVAYMLEGSVRRQNNRIQIRARLLETNTGYHVWSQTYDRAADDIFAVQDEIARAVATELGLVLNVADDTPLFPPPTTSEQAHDLVLRARALYRKAPTAASFDEARRLIQSALELDPEYVGAWLEIARLNNFASGFLGDLSPYDAFQSSKAAIERASAIDPDAAEVLIWRANIHYFDGNLAEAYQLAQRAIEAAPENPGIAFSLGHYHAVFGYTEEALPYLEKATRLDPLDGFAWNVRAIVHQNLKDFEISEAEAQRAVELGDWSALDTRVWNAVQNGEQDAAFAHFMALFETAGRDADQSIGARALWNSLGRAIIYQSEAERLLIEALLKRQFQSEDFTPSAVSISAAARLGLFDAMYKQWRPAYSSKSLIAVSIWSDFEWAKALRRHNGFPTFLQSEGFVGLWQAHGWPPACQPLEGTDGSDGQFICQ